MGKRITLDEKAYGFSGVYWKTSANEKAVIVLMGDKADDIMNKAASKWLCSMGINSLSMTLKYGRKDLGGMHSWPIERIEKALEFLGAQNILKIGILGISLQAALALASSSILDGIGLTMAFAPSDFIPWGFYQGRRGRYHHAEWPSGTSSFSYGGKDLEYLPSCYSENDYYQHYLDEKKAWGEIHTESFFTEAEEKTGIAEEAFIKVENIKGDIVLVGARDDTMWTSSRYIERICLRLDQDNFPYKVHSLIYESGTHILLPEGMVKAVLPVGESLIYRMYKSGRIAGRHCKASRIDLDSQLKAILDEW